MPSATIRDAPELWLDDEVDAGALPEIETDVETAPLRPLVGTATSMNSAEPEVTKAADVEKVASVS